MGCIKDAKVMTPTHIADVHTLSYQGNNGSGDRQDRGEGKEERAIPPF